MNAIRVFLAFCMKAGGTVFAFVGKNLSVLIGLETVEERQFWSELCRHLGFAGIVGGIGAIFAREYPPFGWVAVGCGIICARIGVWLSRKREQPKGGSDGRNLRRAGSHRVPLLGRMGRRLLKQGRKNSG